MDYPPWLRPVLLVLALVLLVLATHGWILGFYFTQPNTFPEIRSSRIQDTGDLVRVLTHPTKSLRPQPDKVHRPVLSLSFSLDYGIWGLEPFGYHLTDLLLVLLLGVGFFFLVRRLTGGEDWTGMLAASLLILNPILLDVLVPISHRQNTLVALFVVLALLGYLRFRTTLFPSRAFAAGLLGTGGLYLLAMASKETGIVFLLIVLGYEVLVPAGSRNGPSWWSGFRRHIPHLLSLLLVAGVYVGWWIRVTGGRALWGRRTGGLSLGPLFASGVLGHLDRFVRENLSVHGLQYGQALLGPSLGALPAHGEGIVGLAKGYFTLVPSAGLMVGSLGLTLGVVSGFLWLLSRLGGAGGFFRRPRGGAGEVLAAFSFRLGAFFVGAALLLAAAFPWVMGVVRPVLGMAYREEGFRLLTSFMESRGTFPEVFYVLVFRRLMFRLITGGTVGGVVMLVLARPGRVWGGLSGWVSDLLSHRLGRAAVFFLLWILAVYLFHAFTNTSVAGHGRKRLLLSLVGYTGLLAVLVRVLPFLVNLRSATGVPSAGARIGAAFAVVLACLLVIGMVLRSPLVMDRAHFAQAQRMHRTFYTQLERRLERLPARATLEIRGLPRWRGWRDRHFVYPHVEGGLLGLNFNAWLKLRFPDRRFDIRRRWNANLFRPCPCAMWIEQKQVGSHYFVLRAHWAQKESFDRWLSAGST